MKNYNIENYANFVELEKTIEKDLLELLDGKMVEHAELGLGEISGCDKSAEINNVPEIVVDIEFKEGQRHFGIFYSVDHNIIKVVDKEVENKLKEIEVDYYEAREKHLEYFRHMAEKIAVKSARRKK